MYGFFLSQVYDKYCGNFAEKMAPIIYNYYTSESIHTKNKNLLDICCGTGQLARYFFQHNFNVYCLDRSLHMLARAKQNMKRTDGTGSAFFINADMVDLPFEMQFSLVVCTYDSINYIDDEGSLLLFFQRVFHSLVPRGVFIFDMQTPLSKDVNSTEIQLIDDGEMFIIAQQFSKREDHAFGQVTGFVRDGNDLYHRFDEIFPNRAFELRIVYFLLQEVGFEKVVITTDEALQKQSVDLEELKWAYIVSQKS